MSRRRIFKEFFLREDYFNVCILQLNANSSLVFGCRISEVITSNTEHCLFPEWRYYLAHRRKNQIVRPSCWLCRTNGSSTRRPENFYRKKSFSTLKMCKVWSLCSRAGRIFYFFCFYLLKCGHHSDVLVKSLVSLKAESLDNALFALIFSFMFLFCTLIEL